MFKPDFIQYIPIKKLSAILLSLFLQCCLSGHANPDKLPEIPARDALQMIKNIQKQTTNLRHWQRIECHLDSAPTTPLILLRHNNPENKKRVLITAGLHGDEPAGILAALEIFNLARNKQFAYTNMDIIPLSNPWGYIYNSRYNSNGIDLNRDFKHAHAPESKCLMRLLESQTYDLILDLHEDQKSNGYYLIALDSSPLPVRNTLNHLAQQQLPISTNAHLWHFYISDGFIQTPRWCLQYNKLSDQLMLGQYLRQSHAGRVYISESPARASLEMRIQMHVQAAQIMIQTILQKGN